MRHNFLILSFILAAISGCSVVPGMHMSQFSDESSIKMPVTENNKTTLRSVNVHPITAQLIIDIEKNIDSRSIGSDNVANHYFDYRIGSKTVKGTPDKEHYAQYLVGPRDILNITVWEHPELTIPAGEFRSAEAAGNIVGEDGNIFYPYAGVVKAAGRTVEEIRAELTRKLSKYIERVQLDVRVASYRSQRVYVVGEVKTPGIQLVKDIPLTVLEAINNAGGVTANSDRRNITLTRDDKSYSINLLALYEGGDTSQNVLLKHGDVLNIPDREFNKIFVLGDTAGSGTGSARSRSIFMNKGRMTLTEAISDGGGTDQQFSDPARIFVFRGGLGKSQVFHLNAKSPDALILADRFPLQPRDIIFINRAEGMRWNQIIEQITPTVNLLNIFDSAPTLSPLIR
ncbi:MAG: polysaccharide biosynthesis/export family protein [Methylococcaceae bacterium]